jgi:regulator of replication initiation timing
VAVYDSIAIRLRPDLDLSAAIELADSIRAERNSYKLGLEDANGRVSELEITLGDTRRDNRALRDELDRSVGIAGDLTDENRHLNERLNESLKASKELGDSHIKLGDSIDSIGDIIDRYSGGVKSK